MTTPTVRYRRARRAAVPLLGAAALVLATPLATTAAADGGGADGHLAVVATGLDNPRQLSFDRRGNLYVAEAGRGGDGPCMAGPEGGTVCFGRTGAITRITTKGSQSRVLTGLPSLAGQGTGEQATGPTDVSIVGTRRLVFTLGLGADPAVRDDKPALAEMGTLREAWMWSTHSTLVADIAAHEGSTNPIADPDSNPGGFSATGGNYVVADAGGNTVLKTNRSGKITTIAVLQDQLADAPPFLGLPAGTKIPSQAVPTSVTKGPDGALYVSQLTGFPFQPGLANIYRIDHRDRVSVYASGLTNVTDLAFGPEGVLYAVELASEGLLSGPFGSLVAIPAGGGSSHIVVEGGLFAPYGVAITGRTAYVTTGSVAPGAGQVVAIPLP
ncbi:MAG: ScyD/ScyE family protein [Ornithinibacter sp.]